MNSGDKQLGGPFYRLARGATSNRNSLAITQRFTAEAQSAQRTDQKGLKSPITSRLSCVLCVFAVNFLG